MNIKSWSADSIWKIYEWAMTQIQLNNLGYELMFIDEFSINFKHNITYGWSPVGVKGYLEVNIEPFCMLFMAGFSKLRFLGHDVTSTLNNSASSLKFVKNTFDHRSKSLILKDRRLIIIIIWDNASLHINKEEKDYIVNTEIIIWTIAPYSPCLNPTERLILYIKKKITRIRQWGKWDKNFDKID